MTLALVSLGLAHPVAQGLVMHTQLVGEQAERRARVGLPIQPNSAFTQLIGTSLVKLILVGL